MSVAALSVRAARLDWRDATTSPAAELALSDFSFAAQAIAWPLDAPVVFSGEGTLGSAADHGKLSFSGQGSGAAATVKVTLAELPMAALRPYLSSLLVPPLAGDLSAEVALDWQGGKGADASGHRRQARAAGQACARRGEESGDRRRGDRARGRPRRTVARSASVGRLALRAPRVRVERDAARRWAFERYGAPGAKRPPPRRGAPAASAASAPRRRRGAVAAGGRRGRDRARPGVVQRPSSARRSGSTSRPALQLRGWALDSKAAAPIHLAARVSVPTGPSGKAVGSGVVGSIDARGELKGFEAGQPAGGKLALLLKDLPMHLLDPYLDAIFSIDVQKAQTSFKGDVRWERPRGTAHQHRPEGRRDRRGLPCHQLTTDRGRIASAGDGPRRDGSAPLLNWKSLSLRGIDLAIAPGRQRASASSRPR